MQMTVDIQNIVFYVKAMHFKDSKATLGVLVIPASILASRVRARHPSYAKLICRKGPYMHLIYPISVEKLKVIDSWIPILNYENSLKRILSQ